MTLSERLAAGKFLVTAECSTPGSADLRPLQHAAEMLAPFVDAANVTDNHAARAKMSPLVGAMAMLKGGLEPILQLTGRDRNILALQSELLGAWAIGVRNVLALSGDPLTVGPYAGLATHVRDADSLSLSKLITSLNSGLMLAGERLETPTSFLIAGAINPLVDTIERIESKLDAGVGLLQTNIVYDVNRFNEWFAPVVEARIPQRAAVLVGVTPPRSVEMLRYLHENIPGVDVDESTFARMKGLHGETAEAEGIRIASEIIMTLRETPGVTGVHLMAPGWTAEAIPRVVAQSGLTR